MKLHIFYRHYNKTGNDGMYRPDWFSYEKCYINLLNTLPEITLQKSDRCRINVVFDGVNDNKENWINSQPFHNIYNINEGSDAGSFFETCKLIKSDESILNDDLIYFLENDYMHVSGWFDKIIELFSTYSGIDYVSLYDHNDKYFLPMYENLVSKIFTTDSHHWRTTPSTCGSFITTKKRFDDDYDVLSTMVGDHNKWLWLNETRSRTVLSPIPGLSTHCMNGLLSPTIKWNIL